MEFAWSDYHEAYRSELRQSIDELLPPNWDDEIAPKSYGSNEQVDFSRIFCRALAEKGLLIQQWPREYGGGDGDAWQQFILAEEMAVRGEPRGPQYMNVNWIGPAIMRHGTDEQKRHLDRIAKGDVIWCQGFSEPSGGTDLAAMKTRAVAQADGSYIINGSKIWTSYSPRADYCFLLARTGDERKAISIFLIPMTLPGIDVTTFAGLVGDGHLNQVFFNDVKVHASMRMGDEGQAWPIVTYALRFERVSVARFQSGMRALNVAVDQLKEERRFDDPAIRARAARIATKLEAGRLLSYYVIDQRTKQGSDNVNGNVARVAVTEAVVELQAFIIELCPDALTGGHPVLAEFVRANLSAAIAAGAYEIQLNLISQDALDLPRER